MIVSRVRYLSHLRPLSSSAGSCAASDSTESVRSLEGSLDSMTTPLQDAPAEPAGLSAAISYVEAVAAAHHHHGTDEAFADELAAADYGDAILVAVAAARQGSAEAAQAWRVVGTRLSGALTVAEA